MNNVQYRLKIILVMSTDLLHKYSFIGNAWNCSQMGCFRSPPSLTLFLVINFYSLAAEAWHCWPCATHLTEWGTMAHRRCRTLGSVPFVHSLCFHLYFVRELSFQTHHFNFSYVGVTLPCQKQTAWVFEHLLGGPAFFIAMMQNT